MAEHDPTALHAAYRLLLESEFAPPGIIRICSPDGTLTLKPAILAPLFQHESDGATDPLDYAQKLRSLSEEIGSMEVPSALSPTGKFYRVPIYAGVGASPSIGQAASYPVHATAIFSREVSPAELAFTYEELKNGPVGAAIDAAEAERAALAKKIVEILRNRFEPLSTEVVISEATLEQCAGEILDLVEADA